MDEETPCHTRVEESESMRPDELLTHLDDDQRRVAQSLGGPVCVLAGAGTGKTRAITYRIAYGVASGVYQPQNVLAVTFTARAAAEMRSRLRDLGVHGAQARTFHSAALRQLSFFWPKVIGGSVPRLVEYKANLVSEAASRLGIEVDRLTVRDLAGEVEWAKVSLVGAEEYPQVATDQGRLDIAGQTPATIGRLISVYEDVKHEAGVIDFEDVLLLMIGILAEHEDVAAQVRRQYRHFVVDEYQDVSPLQQQLLDLWLGGRNELCVVGDVSQTIYSFTGATPSYLTGFGAKHPDSTVITLNRDYRSTPQVVHLANEILARAGTDRGKGAVELISQRDRGPAVVFTEYDDDDIEARGVATKISELVSQGVSPADIAVLYRTNAQSEAVEAALSDAGVGYQVRGGEKFFQRREVREGIVLIRGAVRTASEEPLGEQVKGILTGAGWTPQPPPHRGALRERWEALNALVLLAEDLHTRQGATMAQLVEELTERQEAQHAPSIDGVTLASFHAAKGLEWEAVFLIGLSEGLMPISHAQAPEEIAEERRLLYVGVTRAKTYLYNSYALARPSGRSSRKRTRFYDHIWPQPPPPAKQRGRRRAVDVTDADVNEELFERLRLWRARVAQEVDKPAFTIFHDTTLTSVASVEPKTLKQLALIRGIGPTKLDLYGAQVLAIVRGEDPTV